MSVYIVLLGEGNKTLDSFDISIGFVVYSVLLVVFDSLRWIKAVDKCLIVYDA